jgi:hypothetical protein
MIENEKNQTTKTAPEDPSRRAAMGVGLAAAIAVVAGFAKLATSTASAEPAKRKTGTTYTKSPLPSKKNTPYTKSPKKSTPYTKFPKRSGREPIVGFAPLRPAEF